nr:MAG TPA: hypothetical protein [Caudoviricetes sp.]
MRLRRTCSGSTGSTCQTCGGAASVSVGSPCCYGDCPPAVAWGARPVAPPPGPTRPPRSCTGCGASSPVSCPRSRGRNEETSRVRPSRRSPAGRTGSGRRLRGRRRKPVTGWLVTPSSVCPYN